MYILILNFLTSQRPSPPKSFWSCIHQGHCAPLCSLIQWSFTLSAVFELLISPPSGNSFFNGLPRQHNFLIFLLIQGHLLFCLFCQIPFLFSLSSRYSAPESLPIFVYPKHSLYKGSQLIPKLQMISMAKQLPKYISSLDSHLNSR